MQIFFFLAKSAWASPFKSRLDSIWQRRESRRDQEEGGELDPQVGPEEIKSRVESWTSFCISCYSAAVLQTLSLRLLHKAVETAVAWYTSLLATQWQGDTALVVLAVVHGLLGLPGRCVRSSLHSFSPCPLSLPLIIISV